MQQLILGSSSSFRAQLLKKLGLPFLTATPDIDETTRENEFASDLVIRLSEQKARAIARQYPNALIIGADQVALLDGEILGKPGSHEKAQQQLIAASGKHVRFLTGLALFNAEKNNIQLTIEPYDVYFKKLTLAQIDYYLHQEQPYQCAGSFKSEGFGISLFSKLVGEDPNSLIGLPLLQLIDMLMAEGIDVLQPST